MQVEVSFQLSVFGKTSWERLHQMTGWILEPCSVRSRAPRFQCLLLEAGQAPEWCEGDVLTSPGGLWMPAIGQTPDDWHGGSEFSSWPILEGGVLTKYCLSPAQCSHFLALAQRAGCPPPKEIEALLLNQGGVYPSSIPFSSTGCGEQPSTGGTRSSAAALDGQQTLFPLYWPVTSRLLLSGTRMIRQEAASVSQQKLRANGSWACRTTGQSTVKTVS